MACFSLCVCVYVCVPECVCVYVCVPVCVCMFLCLRVCLCPCISVYVSLPVYVCLCLYVDMFLCLCVCVYICLCLCVCIYLSMCIYTSVCMCLCVSVCMSVCMCLRVCACVFVRMVIIEEPGVLLLSLYLHPTFVWDRSLTFILSSLISWAGWVLSTRILSVSAPPHPVTHECGLAEHTPTPGCLHGDEEGTWVFAPAFHTCFMNSPSHSGDFNDHVDNDLHFVSPMVVSSKARLTQGYVWEPEAQEKVSHRNQRTIPGIQWQSPFSTPTPGTRKGWKQFSN